MDYRTIAIRIANTLSVYEHLKGKTSDLFDRCDTLEHRSALSDEQVEAFKDEIRKVFRQILGPMADNISAFVKDMSISSVLHELGHKLMDPTYDLYATDSIQTAKAKIEEDLDEFVNMALTGEPNYDNLWIEASYKKPMSEIMYDLEHNSTGGPEKRRYLAQLARSFRHQHPELMDVVPSEAFATHRQVMEQFKYGEPEFMQSLESLPMKTFEQFIIPKADQLKSVFLRDGQNQPYMNDYKKFLFALERIVSKYEQLSKESASDSGLII